MPLYQPDTVFVVTDVETDGPVPGLYSMLSFACVAVQPNGEQVGECSHNLLPLPEAQQHPDNMAFWRNEPEAWAALQVDARPAAEVMASFATWWAALPGRPVFAAHPLGFDFGFLNWYAWRFVGRGFLGDSGLDLRTLAMSVLGLDYRRAQRSHYPDAWFGGHPHSHHALDDARGYAALLLHLLAQAEGR